MGGSFGKMQVTLLLALHLFVNNAQTSDEMGVIL